MAKAKNKLTWWQLGLIGLAGVVAAGSFVGLLSDKNDDKEEKHVHEYAESTYTSDDNGDVAVYSNICSECGERMEVINASEVKVGYNLQGYKMRYVESKKADLVNYLAINGEGLVGLTDIDTSGIIGFYPGSPWFGDALDYKFCCDSTGVSFADGNGLVYFGSMTSVSLDALPEFYDHDPFGEDYAYVAFVGANNGLYAGDGKMGDIWSYFEFYYVGEAELDAAAASETSVQVVAETVADDSENLGMANPEEWSFRY